eukprot:scaffold171_cov263-Pinguiococcus_pyrenoidosus.AAC.8
MLDPSLDSARRVLLRDSGLLANRNTLDYFHGAQNACQGYAPMRHSDAEVSGNATQPALAAAVSPEMPCYWNPKLAPERQSDSDAALMAIARARLLGSLPPRTYEEDRAGNTDLVGASGAKDKTTQACKSESGSVSPPPLRRNEVSQDGPDARTLPRAGDGAWPSELTGAVFMDNRRKSKEGRRSHDIRDKDGTITRIDFVDVFILRPPECRSNQELSRSWRPKISNVTILPPKADFQARVFASYPGQRLCYSFHESLLQDRKIVQSKRDAEVVRLKKAKLKLLLTELDKYGIPLQEAHAQKPHFTTADIARDSPRISSQSPGEPALMFSALPTCSFPPKALPAVSDAMPFQAAVVSHASPQVPMVTPETAYRSSLYEAVRVGQHSSESQSIQALSARGIPIRSMISYAGVAPKQANPTGEAPLEKLYAKVARQAAAQQVVRPHLPPALNPPGSGPRLTAKRHLPPVRFEQSKKLRVDAGKIEPPHGGSSAAPSREVVRESGDEKAHVVEEAESLSRSRQSRSIASKDKVEAVAGEESSFEEAALLVGFAHTAKRNPSDD